MLYRNSCLVTERFKSGDPIYKEVAGVIHEDLMYRYLHIPKNFKIWIEPMKDPFNALRVHWEVSECWQVLEDNYLK